MKANRDQIARALSAPTADIRLYLLYGPDESGSQALAKRLESAMGEGAQRIDLDGPALKGDPARLADEAAAFSMFGDKQWVRSIVSGDEVLPAVEALLEAGQVGNPVVMIAGALKPTSKLLKLALASPMAMAFASYVPEGRDAERVVVDIAREEGLRMPNDLARRIVELTGGDRGLIRGEVEKLVLYLDVAPDRPGDASAEALAALSAGMEEESLDLVDAVMGGDLALLARDLPAVTRGNGQEAGLLRALLNRAQLLAAARAGVDAGHPIDAAVKAAGRVFWKDEDAVKRQLRLWSAPAIARVVHRLLDAEAQARSGHGAGPVQISQELLTIARQAARGR